MSNRIKNIFDEKSVLITVVPKKKKTCLKLSQN